MKSAAAVWGVAADVSPCTRSSDFGPVAEDLTPISSRVCHQPATQATSQTNEHLQAYLRDDPTQKPWTWWPLRPVRLESASHSWRRVSRSELRWQRSTARALKAHRPGMVHACHGRDSGRQPPVPGRIRQRSRHPPALEPPGPQPPHRLLRVVCDPDWDGNLGGRTCGNSKWWTARSARYYVEHARSGGSTGGKAYPGNRPGSQFLRGRVPRA